MTVFSPKATGTVDTRISASRSSSLRPILMRPSWGRRFSAISSRARLLIREVIAEWTALGSL